MARKATELTAKEAKVIGSIPSAKKASTIWARFESRKLQAKEDRLALGQQLIIVRDKLATAGCKGLFTRWLLTQSIPHDRAYVYIALAGGGKQKKTTMKCYKRKLSFLRFQTLLTKAESNEEKLQILSELTNWVVEEYSITVAGDK